MLNKILHSFISLSLLALLTVSAVASPLAGAGGLESRAVSKVAKGWYPSWLAGKISVNDIPWAGHSHMSFAFAETTDDPKKLIFDGNLLKQFVSVAKAKKVKAQLSVGGWTGSISFSKLVSTASSRTAFVKTLLDIARQYNLDGIDLDWEYPGAPNSGNTCNTANKDDTANYLLFLEEFRKDDFGYTLILTAATHLFPFKGPDGLPMANVKPFSRLFDHVAIMAYDIWGSWSSTVGPNAPAFDACAAPANQQGSAERGLKSWIAAGFPAEKTVLAIPFYSRSYYVTAQAAFVKGSKTELAAYPVFDKTKLPLGDQYSDYELGNKDQCGNPIASSGIFTYRGLVENGFVKADGSAASSDIVTRFDTCSQTPFFYSKSKGIYASYENPQSMAAKGKLIKDLGVRGFASWTAVGDYENNLLNAIQANV